MAAKDLYTGQLFKVERAYAETFADNWYILSGLHGLMCPTDIVEPYDFKLTASNTAYNEKWGSHTAARMICRNPSHGARIVVLAPALYCDLFLPRLARTRPDLHIEQPLRHLGIGQQKHWLREHIAKFTTNEGTETE
jgi:hypothetical protein